MGVVLVVFVLVVVLLTALLSEVVAVVFVFVERAAELLEGGGVGVLLRRQRSHMALPRALVPAVLLVALALAAASMDSEDGEGAEDVLPENCWLGHVKSDVHGTTSVTPCQGV